MRVQFRKKVAELDVGRLPSQAAVALWPRVDSKECRGFRHREMTASES